MSKFDSFFLMSCDNVLEYVREKTNIFHENAHLKVNEIGDGNINYVFRVEDEERLMSIIIKQAGDNSRINPSSSKLTKDRNRIEAEILLLFDKYMHGCVPEVYKYDEVMHCYVMEDLQSFNVMRSELIKGRRYSFFADKITDFFTAAYINTIDIVMNPIEKKELVKRYINPELCEITERLVFTQPYTNSLKRNMVNPLLEKWVREDIYNDKELKLEAMKLKYSFMNNPQALIHGDLHTGSIFISEKGMKIFDPEFAFFGPIGYDIGNVIANLSLSICRFTAINDENSSEFIKALIQDIGDIIENFIVKFKKELKIKVSDELMNNDEVISWYLDKILSDTAGMCGTEMIRRIIGYAKVADIETIDNDVIKTVAEKKAIEIGKYLIMNREKFKRGKDYSGFLKNEIFSGN